MRTRMIVRILRFPFPYIDILLQAIFWGEAVGLDTIVYRVKIVLVLDWFQENFYFYIFEIVQLLQLSQNFL